MKIAAPVLLALVLVCMAGCLPVSQNPLSSPEKAVADARLAGVWYGRSGEDTVFLHFVADQSSRMDVVEVDHQKNGGAHATIYTMFPTVIDGVRYMNVQEKKSANKSYYLARYKIDGDGRLTIWLMSEKPVAAAVKSEKIPGKVTSKESSSGKADHDVTITADTGRLAAFVRKSDPEVLFAEKFGTFKKLTLPAAEATPAATPVKKEGVPPKPGRKKKKTNE